MLRIRSIKPEFWRDEKIAKLKNKLAGYFFIGLWNVADDEGKFKLDPKSLALQLPIFRTKEVVIYLSELSQKGLIVKSECSQWGLIAKWHHQKISNPTVPYVKKEQIKWVTDIDSRSGIEHSVSPHPLLRIGEDRKGREGIGGTTTPVENLLTIWQQHSGSLPKLLATNLTSNELVKIRERMEEAPDKEYWVSIVNKLASTPFFCGENDRKWKADFLWLIEPGNHVKVMNREYSTPRKEKKNNDSERSEYFKSLPKDVQDQIIAEDLRISRERHGLK